MKANCETCNTTENLTRHHVKNSNGNKTGDIRILCRSCHDKIEEEYRLNGMIKPQPDTKRLTNKKHVDPNDLNYKPPFYSTSNNINALKSGDNEN